MKTFTLDEAQSLLPVLESLLKRAIDSKEAAEAIEAELTELSRRIYLAGGMHINMVKVAAQRSAVEEHVKLARESVAEIDEIGVQVKDIDTGCSISLPGRGRNCPALLEARRRIHRALAHRRVRIWRPPADRRALPPPFRPRQPAQPKSSTTLEYSTLESGNAPVSPCLSPEIACHAYRRAAFVFANSPSKPHLSP